MHAESRNVDRIVFNVPDVETSAARHENDIVRLLAIVTSRNRDKAPEAAVCRASNKRDSASKRHPRDTVRAVLVEILRTAGFKVVGS